MLRYVCNINDLPSVSGICFGTTLADVVRDLRKLGIAQHLQIDPVMQADIERHSPDTDDASQGAFSVWNARHVIRIHWELD